MRFVRLTNAHNGLTLILNPSHIVGCFEQPDGTTTVEFRSSCVEENVVSVKESIAHIKKVLYDV